MMLRIAFAVIMLATALGEPRQAVGPTKNVASPATTTIPVAVIPLPATPAGPLDTAEKILKIAAYIVGAAWIYFN